MIRAIVTDIEGTTSDIRFVHDVLFPHARQRLATFVKAHQYQPNVAHILGELREETARPQASTDELIAILLEFMNEDRKSTSLKALQGVIWREGYLSGAFKGHLYPDVLPALQKWRTQDINLYVYSSGSVDAQKLLFGYSDAGDITPLFSGYFDTRTGAKRDVSAYRAIVRELHLPAEQILFLSDTHQELDAAAAAGLQTVQLIRDLPDTASHHRQVSRFDHIEPEKIP